MGKKKKSLQIISFKVIHLMKNPINGGKPPRDKKFIKKKNLIDLLGDNLSICLKKKILFKLSKKIIFKFINE